MIQTDDRIGEKQSVEHKSYVRTRYCESDVFGHINNVSYFIYLEQARVDFFVELGMLEKQTDWSFIVASARCDYRSQAYVNQKLVIQTFVTHIGRTSFKLSHQIVDQESNVLIAEGEVILVQFDFYQQESIRLSEELTDILKKYLLES